MADPRQRTGSRPSAVRPPLTIALTRAQQLEILAATGLRVRTLELPWVEDGADAQARLPIPDWLKERVVAR